MTFQFHKGTIRTAKIQGQIDKNTKFQFHKGTIRTVKTGVQNAGKVTISIP